MKLEFVKFKKPSLILLVFALGVVSTFAALRGFGKTLPSVPLNNLSQTVRVIDEESAVIDAVQKVSPSVVSIAVENRQLFDPLFGFSQPTSKQSGIGTGFVVSKDGLILTNKHVVAQEGEKYIAITRDKNGLEKKMPVTQINRDPFNDLAIIKVEATDLIPVDFGDSDKLKVGQKVIAIGNALGQFENTVTTGVVSGLGRGVSPIDPLTGVAEKLDDLVQTDAAINPGNSGGPLVNILGQVIAIDTAIADAQNIGFAIKINIAKQLIDDFKSSGGKISRPQLGVTYTHIPRDVALLNEVPEGELVRSVIAGSGAFAAGIKVGDIITQLDGRKLTDENTLSSIIRTKKVGDTVKIRLFRVGQTIDLTATLKEASTQ
ncbi:MAG: trypsin-like peptidase domain-containing protein [Candidatus Curtissbacteria bacterium]|nr:trypsin-like peptidase domain-containing protein [Candidatus Curtissbacteria bacterium]